MRIGVAVGLALVVLGSLPPSVFAQRGRPGRGEPQAIRNGWLFSLREGQAEARKTGKPLMVVVRCVP